MGLTPIVSRPALADLLHTTDDGEVGKWNGRIMACFLLGAACGGVAFGWLGDKIGRVRAMIFSILTYSIFMGCGYFATHPWHLGLCLFISALGMGGQWSLGRGAGHGMLAGTHRPKLAGVIGAASNVGFLMIAVVGTCLPAHARVVAMVDARRGQPRGAWRCSSCSRCPNRSAGRRRRSKGGGARCWKSSRRRCSARRCWPSPLPAFR